MYALQLRAHQKHTGSARRGTYLGHRRDFDPRVRHPVVHPNISHNTSSSRWLRGSDRQLGLLHRDSIGMLSDMPTFGLQLG